MWIAHPLYRFLLRSSCCAEHEHESRVAKLKNADVMPQRKRTLTGRIVAKFWAGYVIGQLKLNFGLKGRFYHDQTPCQSRAQDQCPSRPRLSIVCRTVVNLALLPKSVRVKASENSSFLIEIQACSTAKCTAKLEPGTS